MTKNFGSQTKRSQVKLSIGIFIVIKSANGYTFKSSQIKTINCRSRLTDTKPMFICMIIVGRTLKNPHTI